mmetsp:Transcript_164185/g.290731  ORF Transcript_164185/g.290731 Transcript_164185/m.290731 type:complete len:156 (+) Transcript_164185:2-469(+)
MDGFEELVLKRHSMQSHLKDIEATIADIKLKGSTLLTQSCAVSFAESEPKGKGARSSRRSGPGDGAGYRRPIGSVTLEVNRIVKPQKDSLKAMILKKCPWLTVEQPEGSRNYARVSVPLDQEDEVRTCIKSIAQDKMRSGVRITVVDQCFESPRD